jgi:hypothetical protein
MPDVYEEAQAAKLGPLETNYSENPRIKYAEKPLSEKFDLKPSRGTWSGRRFTVDKMKMSGVLDLVSPKVMGEALISFPKLSVSGSVSALARFSTLSASKTRQISISNMVQEEIQTPKLTQITTPAPSALIIRERTPQKPKDRTFPTVLPIIGSMSDTRGSTIMDSNVEQKPRQRQSLQQSQIFASETEQRRRRGLKPLFKEAKSKKGAKQGFRGRLEYTPTASIEKLRKRMGL